MDGALHFVATQDNKQVLVSLEQMRQEFSRMQDVAQQSGESLDATFDKLKSTLVGVAGGVASVATLKELGAQVLNVRGEFQQLEIAFGTMLGSGEKANKLMTQLTQTAAKTPFDLKGIAGGAKQLLAYGIAADEVNDTLVHLGDIAAGLSIPLNDMVMLYGTTMVQGRMFTQDLRQFQGRGIPIMEALANTMGVTKDAVSELVSTGKVGAQEFQTALMSLTAEGGKFGGLMDKQSQSISGQISNIEDGISMMFNEIGQKSEGVINTALSGVSALVENYETVGKAILAVAGTYGTYKAALVVVSAVEKAHASMLQAAVLEKKLAAAANITLSNSDAMAAARKAFFTKTIKANTKAILRNTAAMLTNPAVLITAGLVALCATIYAVSKALNTQAKAQERVNKLNEQQQEERDNAKSEADQAIQTIKSETATVYDKAKAYETLKKLMPELTNQYSQQELATLDLVKAQKAEAQALENMEFDSIQKEIDESTKKIEKYKRLLSRPATNKGGAAQQNVIRTKLREEEEYNKQLLEQQKKMQKLREQAQFDAQPAEVKIAKFTADKEAAEKQLADLQKQAEDAAAKAKEAWEQNPLNEWKIKIGMTFEQAAGNDPSLLGGQYAMLQPLIKGLQQQIQETDGQIAALQDNTTKQTLPQLIASIQTAEKAVEEARRKYAADMTDANKKAVEGAEATLKTVTDDYKTATGKVWVSTKQMYEDIAKAREQALNERQRILNSSIQAERVQREAAYWQTIKEINQEEAAYKKAHNGRTSSEFALKRENATIQFDLDTQEFDRRFEEWKRNFENETLRITIDSDMEQMEQAAENAINIAEKIRLQNELYERQIELKKQENKLEADNTVRSKYGEKTLADYNAFSANENNAGVLSSYRSAKTPEERKEVARNAGLDESLLATYSEMEQIYQQYEQRLNATIQAAERGHNAEMLRQDIDDYAAYCEEIIEAAREREEALAAIESGQDTNRTKAMVEADYQAKVKRAGEDHSIDATEQEAAAIVARLVNSLADVTYDQVDAAAQTFFEQLDEQMHMLEEVQGMSQEQRDAAAQQAQQDLEQLQAQEGNPNATDEQKAEIQGRIAEIEQRLVYLKMTESQMDGQMVKLLQTKRTMEDSVATAKQSSGKKSVKQMQTEQRVTNKVVDALGEVSSAAKAVANTMGGVLSKKSKKALGVISDVADFGIQSIQSIQYVATNASTLMESTAVGAAGAIQTVEKASVILTIISLAVQAIMAIVNIAKQFTQNAKVNEELDDMAANIERLKEEQRDLDWQMRNSKGVQYFKDNAAAAKNLTKQIEANRAAYEKSLKEEERLNRKYGSDSDKASDQHERTQEFKEAWEDAISEQEERWQEMVDTILTTDLSGWADTLADSAIEAAMDGSKSFQEIWNEALEQWERDMYKQQLKLAYEELFKDSFDRFSAKARAVAEAGGQLSESDIDEFVAEMENKQDEAERLAEMYRELMERRGLLTDESDVEGSKGGFQSMSQDTADELNARFTALQIEGANVVTETQTMRGLLEGIADNDRLRLVSIQSMASNIDIGVTIQQNILDQVRIIAETAANIKEDTARLRAIEQNTDKL